VRVLLAVAIMATALFGFGLLARIYRHVDRDSLREASEKVRGISLFTFWRPWDRDDDSTKP
jgi:hypothetical protein